MTASLRSDRIATLTKAELRRHLAGSIQPVTVCALTARHADLTTEEEVRQRYAYRDFPEFIEAFKWLTSFLRELRDYQIVATDLAQHFFTQLVFYTEYAHTYAVMHVRK